MSLKLLGRSAGSTRQRTFRAVQGRFSCTKNGDARGQCVKERFDDHLRLTKASIEVVVERIELFPTGGGLNGQAGGNIVGILFKFRTKMFDGVREDAKLMEKA